MAMTVTLDCTMPRNLGLWNHFSTGILALDTAYPALGYPIVIGQFGMQSKLDAIIILGGLDGLLWEWDRIHGTLRFRQNIAAHTEVVAGTNLSAEDNIPFIALGW